MKSKTELLKEMKLDRSAENTNHFGAAKWLITVVFGLAFVFLLVFFIRTNSGFDSARQAARGSPDAIPRANSARTIPARSSVDSAENRTDIAQAALVRADVDLNTVILDVSGYITANRIATVSATTIGLITEVTVEEGAWVEKGQTLALLDSSLAQLDLDLARAQFDRLQSDIARVKLELSEAIRVYERQETLRDSEFANEADLTRAKTSVDTFTVALKAAELDSKVAAVQIARRERVLKDFTIVAPFSGIVAMRNAQPGEIISPSSAGGGYTRTGICTIIDMDSLEIEVDVNESFIRLIHEDQEVLAELYAYEGWTFTGKVRKILPSADRAKSTVRVRIHIVNKDPRILPDMAVKVSFLKS